MSFDSDGILQGQKDLTAEEIINFELLMINDIDGDGVRGFRFVSELLSPDALSTTNTYRMRLSETTAGLALSASSMNPTHGAGQTGSDVTSGLLTAANSDEGLIVNITNFAIPTDSDPVFARRIVERVKTVEVPAGELQTTGYELYTREDNEEGIVVRHLFNRDGSHSDNEELSGLKLVQAELQTGVDLNGDGEISLSIESKLTTQIQPQAHRASSMAPMKGC